MQPHLTSYGLAALERGFRLQPEVARRELLAAAREATLLLELDVVGHYPAHTGVTRGSIGSDAFSTPAGVLGLVGTAAPVAAFVELGTKPHTPPLEPLLQWVAGVLGKTGSEGEAAARGIQRKIAAQGSKSRPLFQHALRRHTPAITAMFEAAAGRVAAALEGGVS